MNSCLRRASSPLGPGTSLCLICTRPTRRKAASERDSLGQLTNNMRRLKGEASARDAPWPSSRSRLVNLKLEPRRAGACDILDELHHSHNEQGRWSVRTKCACSARLWSAAIRQGQQAGRMVSELSAQAVGDSNVGLTARLICLVVVGGRALLAFSSHSAAWPFGAWPTASHQTNHHRQSDAINHRSHGALA